MTSSCQTVRHTVIDTISQKVNILQHFPLVFVFSLISCLPFSPPVKRGGGHVPTSDNAPTHFLTPLFSDYTRSQAYKVSFFHRLSSLPLTLFPRTFSLCLYIPFSLFYLPFHFFPSSSLFSYVHFSLSQHCFRRLFLYLPYSLFYCSRQKRRHNICRVSFYWRSFHKAPRFSCSSDFCEFLTFDPTSGTFASPLKKNHILLLDHYFIRLLSGF